MNFSISKLEQVMKKLIGAMVVGMALMAAGCSDQGQIKDVDGSGPIAESGGADPASTAQALNTVELRMRAEGAEQFTRLMLVPNDVKAFADGVEILVKPTWREVNLANMEHAEQVATFTLPEGAKEIAFKVDLGAAGGFESATGSGWVDTRQSVLDFQVKAAELDQNKKAVIIIDARRSFIVRDAATLAVVPNFRID